MTPVKEGSLLNKHPQLTVKGVGFDRTLGGLEMDIRLRDFLAERFEVRDKLTMTSRSCDHMTSHDHLPPYSR